ncbi:hypothetical protein PMAYCL1PPCAC_00780, partial [Pristionchus mayeri]
EVHDGEDLQRITEAHLYMELAINAEGYQDVPLKEPEPIYVNDDAKDSFEMIAILKTEKDPDFNGLDTSNLSASSNVD